MEQIRLRWERVLRAAARRFGSTSNSLARTARRERDRLVDQPRFTERLWSFVRGRTLTLIRSPWLALYWVFFVLLPIDGPHVTNAHFLGQLWGVLAAALALSLVLQVFALERFSTLREAVHPQALLDFARETGLLGLFTTGVGAILAIGIVLLEAGPARSDGWAGAYSTTLALGTLALLAVLFPEVLTAADPARRRKRRLARIRAGVQAAIDRQVLERIALNHLQKRLPAGAVLAYVFAKPLKQGESRLLAEKRGEVVDADLGLLTSLADELSSESITVHARLGQQVSETTRLATLPGSLNSFERLRARQLYVIGPAADPLEVQRRRLRVEASTVLPSSDIDAHEEIRDAYEELLLAVPRGWQRYRQQYAGNIAGAIDPLHLSVQQELISDLWQFVTDTAVAHVGEIGRRAVYLPLSIGVGAIELKADALLQSLAELQVQVYSTLRDAERPQTRQLGSRAITQLAELAKYFLAAVVEDDEESTIDQRMAAAKRLLGVYLALGDALKECVDARDGATARELLQQWSEILWRRRRADQGNEDESENDHSTDEKLVAPLRALAQRERLTRFGAAMWAVRRVGRTEKPEEYREVLEVIAGPFGSVERIFSALGEALSLKHEDPVSDRWSRWILHDLGPGVHSIAPDLEVLRAALILALWRLPLGDALKLRPAAWLAGRKDTLERDISAIANDAAVKLLVPAAEIQPRVEALAAAVKEAIAKQKDIDLAAVANTPLDPGKVATLRARIRDGWSESRVVPSFFRRAGSPMLATPDPADTKPIIVRFRVDRTLLQAEDVIGSDDMGSRIGEDLALLEFGTLAGQLRGALPLIEVPGQPRAGLDAAVAELRANGLNPSLFIAPVDWRLERALGLRDITGPAPSLPDWWGFPARAGHWYRGRYEDITVFGHPGMPKGEVIVVDLAKIGTWREVVQPGADLPTVALDELAPEDGKTPIVVVAASQLFRFDIANLDAGRRLLLKGAEDAQL